MQEQVTSSLPSSSERSSSSAQQMEVKEGMESDEEIRRVPEFGIGSGGPSTSGRGAASAGPDKAQSSTQPDKKRRGRSPADKEHKRLKRLLRNRVSAQQARERKKAYLNDLEARVKELEKNNSELDERVSTLQNENNMLRQILKNTTVSRRGSGSNANGEGVKGGIHTRCHCLREAAWVRCSSEPESLGLCFFLLSVCYKINEVGQYTLPPSSNAFDWSVRVGQASPRSW